MSLLFIKCKKKEHTKISDSEKKEVTQSRFAKNYPEFDLLQLEQRLAEATVNDSVLSPFYQSSQYASAWVHDTLDTDNLYKFVDVLGKTEEHGLPATVFPTSIIKALTDSVDLAYYKDMDTLYARIVTLDTMATKAAIKYISGMKYGFLNPKRLFGKDYDINIARPDSAFYVNLYNDIKTNPIDAFLAAHPADDMYLNLKKEYDLLKEGEERGFPKINSGNTTFKIGDKSRHITHIAQRLIFTGEYQPQFDSIPTDSLSYTLDDELLEAINKFRRHNSLPEEKEVGKLTIEALNRPLEYYQQKIRANMERYRWQRTKAKHNKHIEVNVASAMLVASQKDSADLLISRICVGSIKNKTPLLDGNISYMNLNPYWNVPRSITVKEIIGQQKNDPAYIHRNNMKIFKGGKEVSVSSIDWKKADPAKFPYMIRQEPGPRNALGLVKFMFNNTHSVYLHDTPNKVAFNRKNRAISHGCIRVQKPYDLAFFCASPVTDVFKDRFFYSIGKDPQSKEGKELLKANKLKKVSDIINIDKENRISLFIDYYTVYTYPGESSLYYADDVYEYDNLILSGLGFSSDTKD